MKRYLLLFVLFLGSIAFAKNDVPKDIGSLTPDQYDDLQDKVKISSVNDDIDENDMGEDCLFLKISTYQPVNDEYKYRIRVLVELTEKKTKKTYYTKYEREQGSTVAGGDYTGEDNWRFILPVDNLERPKLTAYVIQYGIWLDNKFIVVAEDTDDVDTAEELVERAGTLLEQRAKIEHQFSFTEASGRGDVQQSSWK